MRNEIHLIRVLSLTMFRPSLLAFGAICALGTSTPALAQMPSPMVAKGTQLTYEVQEAGSVSGELAMTAVGQRGPWTIYLGDPGGHEYYYAEALYGVFSSDCLHSVTPSDERIAEADAQLSALGFDDRVFFTLEGTDDEITVSEVYRSPTAGIDGQGAPVRRITVSTPQAFEEITRLVDIRTGYVLSTDWGRGYMDTLIAMTPVAEDLPELSDYELYRACPPIFREPVEPPAPPRRETPPPEPEVEVDYGAPITVN